MNGKCGVHGASALKLAVVDTENVSVDTLADNQMRYLLKTATHTLENTSTGHNGPYALRHAREETEQECANTLADFPHKLSLNLATLNKENS